MNRRRTKDIYCSKTTLHDTVSWCIHVFIHSSKLREYTTLRVNPNVKNRLWVIRMCQCISTAAAEAGPGRTGEVSQR